MAEPSIEYLKKLADFFCKRLNEENKTELQFLRKEEKQTDADFYIGDKNSKIGIQLSRLQTIPEWLQTSAYSSRITERLRDEANSMGIKCIISIEYRDTPTREDEITDFVSAMSFILRKHLRTGLFVPEFIRNTDLPKLNIILQVLSRFEILETDSSDFGVIEGNIKWDYQRTIEEDEQFIFEQIAKKNGKYAPTADIRYLLFDASPLAITGLSLNSLRSKCLKTTFNFNQIWLVSFANDGYCDKIYPIRNT